MVSFEKYYAIVPHSLFFFFLINNGLVGLFSISLLWAALFRKIKKLIKDIERKGISFNVIISLYVFLFGWLITNIFAGADFLSIELIVTFWGLLGLVTGMHESGRQEKDTRTEAANE